jgi:hypothetical protein
VSYVNSLAERGDIHRMISMPVVKIRVLVVGRHGFTVVLLGSPKLVSR